MEARIELWNRNTGEITFPKTKSKYNRWTKKFIAGSPKTMKLTSNTNEMLRHHVGNRKKGHVFISEYPEYICEETKSHALKELIRNGIVEKRRNAFYLPEERGIYE